MLGRRKKELKNNINTLNQAYISSDGTSSGQVIRKYISLQLENSYDTTRDISYADRRSEYIHTYIQSQYNINKNRAHDGDIINKCIDTSSVL